MSTLTDVQKDTLRTHLADQKYQDLLNAGMPGHVVDLLNAKTETITGQISRSDLATWAAATDMRKIIEDKANDTNSPLRSSALAIVDVLKGASNGIDLSKPSNMAILDGWENGGALSPEDKASMLALAQRPASLAEVLGLSYVTEEMLREI